MTGHQEQWVCRVKRREPQGGCKGDTDPDAHEFYEDLELPFGILVCRQCGNLCDLESYTMFIAPSGKNLTF